MTSDELNFFIKCIWAVTACAFVFVIANAARYYYTERFYLGPKI